MERKSGLASIRLRGAHALSTIVLLGLLAPLHADESEQVERKLGWKAGADIFFGIANLAGPTKRITDRHWAAVQTFEPSVVYVEWAGGSGDDLRLSVGVGDNYVGSDRSTKQPVECLWRRPIGTATLTLGKHWTPFAQQEWEYETRWGAMCETDLGQNTVALSLTHNEDTDAANALARVGREVADGVEVGISAAAGRGWSYSTSHSKGYGLDVLAELGSLTVTAEAMVAEGPYGRFSFGFLKTMYDAGRGWRPYVGAYYGHDTAEEQGELRSAVLGVEVDAAPHLMIEPGVGRASGRNVWWLTGRLTF